MSNQCPQTADGSQREEKNLEQNIYHFLNGTG